MTVKCSKTRRAPRPPTRLREGGHHVQAPGHPVAGQGVEVGLQLSAAKNHIILGFQDPNIAHRTITFDTYQGPSNL